jgi:hypothetical protein
MLHHGATLEYIQRNRRSVDQALDREIRITTAALMADLPVPPPAEYVAWEGQHGGTHLSNVPEPRPRGCVTTEMLA